MNLKRIINLKNKLKSIKINDNIGKKERKYALLAGLTAFAVLNTGFTAQSTAEIADSQSVQAEQAADVIPSDEMKLLIAEESKNLPSRITISDSGSITLAENDAQKQLLTEVVGNTMANVGDVDNMKGIAEGEAVEEPEFIDEVEEISSVPDYSDGSMYTSVMAMEATAYLPTDGNGAGVTAMGIPATYGVAAVDPGVIPLGSRLYIPGYGEAIAADTGGAIYGYKIDLCMESYEDAMNFGRRTITVYVLK